MNEFETVERRRKKKKKIKKGRIAIVTVLVFALVLGGGYFAFVKLFPQNAEVSPTNVTPTPEEPVRKRTTFQELVNEEYANATFVGDAAEIDLVARYFATNLFTMWGLDTTQVDYGGQDLIPDDYRDTFDKQVKGNLFFQFPQIVEQYGADNLPIVTSVDVTLEKEVYTEYKDEDDYDGYVMNLVMHYQDGTTPGTENVDYAKTNVLLKQWVYSAQVEFFWLPGEEAGTGSWKVAVLKDVVSNEHAGAIV